jgi:excisionase family DNA binding protein
LTKPAEVWYHDLESGEGFLLGEVTVTKLLTYDEVAERVGCSPRQVRRFVKDGKLPPPIRFGYKTLRFHPAEVENHLNQLASGVEQ